MAGSSYQGDGWDWGLEGTPKWWWKYVIPSPEVFYGRVLAQANRSALPEAGSWLQHASGEIMEGLAMFHAATRMGDREGSARLKSEAHARLTRAINTLGNEAGFGQNDSIGSRPQSSGPEIRTAG